MKTFRLEQHKKLELIMLTYRGVERNLVVSIYSFLIMQV